MTSKAVIFKRALYDTRWSILWWGIGVGLMGLYVVVAYPLIEGLDEFNALMQSPVFQFVLGDMSQIDWSSPQGFICIEFFSWIPLILAVYAVMFAVGVTAGEESHRTIDLLLSTPTPRWQVISEKFLAYVVAVMGILLIGSLMTLLGIFFTPKMQPSTGILMWGMLNILPTMLFIAAFTICLGAALRTTSRIGGIAAAILIASYFLNSIADMTRNNLMEALRTLSFYKYYAPLTMVTEGINWGYFTFLLLLSALLFGLALWLFERRDIYV